MMRKRTGLVALLILSCCLPARAFQLSGFDSPESIIRDPESGAIFVSNMGGDPYTRDGNGYISRISASGSVVIQRFIGGKPEQPLLHSPKGLAIWANKLMVADLDRVHIFDKKNGTHLRTIDFGPLGASLLNGMAVNSSGQVYVSDTIANKIFGFDIQQEDPPKIVREGAELGGPNGLAVNPRSSNLLIVSWSTGSVMELDRSARLHILKRGLKNLDGVTFDDQWNLYVSSLTKGEIYKIPFLGRGTLSVFTSNLQGPADISYDRRKRELLVPLTNAGTVESIPQLYPLKQKS